MFILKSYSVFMFGFTLGVFKKVSVFSSLPYLELAWIFLSLNYLCLWVKHKTMECQRTVPLPWLRMEEEEQLAREKFRRGEMQTHCGQGFPNNTIQGGDRPGVLSPSGRRFARVVESGPKSLHLEYVFYMFFGSEAQKMAKYV